MSNLVEFAKREFSELGWLDGDDKMQKLVCENVIELLQAFSNQGHSGFSGGYILSLFSQLVNFNPITEVKDENLFWSGCGRDVMQHKKMPTIFKSNGKTYWIDGVVFECDSGTRWSSSDSKMIVDMPLRASDLKTEVILVDSDGKCLNGDEFEKYMKLSERMVRPNIDGRRPEANKNGR